MLHLLHIGFDTGHPARDRGTIRTNIPTSRNSREGMRQTLYHRYPHSRHSESMNRLPATVYDQKSSQNFRKRGARVAATLQVKLGQCTYLVASASGSYFQKAASRRLHVGSRSNDENLRWPSNVKAFDPAHPWQKKPTQ